MSFDDDPHDAHKRFLLSHAESDCLFEVFSEAERDDCIMNGDGLVTDVTDVLAFELRFKARLKK
jgi:hypothetical protein